MCFGRRILVCCLLYGLVEVSTASMVRRSFADKRVETLDS